MILFRPTEFWHTTGCTNRMSFDSFRTNHPVHLLRSLRPHQWAKSGFVFIGLIFSHQWREIDICLRVVATAIAFALVSSAIYIFNDISDIEKDKVHLDKRKRPIPAGHVTAGWACATGFSSLVAGLALGFFVSPQALIILIVYVLLSIAYNHGLRELVILDVFSIAAGFLMRIFAGTIGVDIPPSDWLLQCGFMVALFLGFAKRRAELGIFQEGTEETHRKVLGAYTPGLLDKFISITAAGVITSYTLYTTDPDTLSTHDNARLIYTTPFIIYGIFRYVYLLHNGRAGDPARDLFGDKHLLATVAVWFAVTIWMLEA